MLHLVKRVYKYIVPHDARVCLLEYLIFSHPLRMFNTLLFQARDAFSKKHAPLTCTKKITILIPTLSKGKQLDHLPALKNLLKNYLSRQTYANYEALVYCDGRNEMVEQMVAALGDDRIKVYSTERTLAKWGHPQTRMGIALATGDFFVRLNDDNKPNRRYLETLVSGFNDDVGFVYGRVIYNGEARKVHDGCLKWSFVIPGDRSGVLKTGNIDCMNYMVKTTLAKKYIEQWDDSFAADWVFISALIKDGVRSRFINSIIGEKI